MQKQSSIIYITIVIFFLSIGTASAISDPFVNININNTENVTLAIHSDSVPNGNWIELIGGTKIKIPSLNLIYNGTNASNYPTSNGNVNITLAVENNTDIKVKYPFSEHSMYTNVSGKKDVDIIFNGSSDFANQGVDIYLIKTTTTDIENTFTDIYNGNTTSFRNLLNSATKKLINTSLNADGDNSSIGFGEIDAGSYVIFILLNSTSTHLENPIDLTILSGTLLEVLEYDSVVSAPTSANIGNIVDVSITLINASQDDYTYGVMLFHSDSYQMDVRLTYNGTEDSVNLTANDADIIVGLDLITINKTTAQNIAEKIIGTNNGLVKIQPETNKNSTSLLINTNGLRAGKYYLIIGVYESGENLVAFHQSEITLSTPSLPPSGGGGGGGGGGASGEAYENIVCTETDRQYVGKDLNVKYNYTLECNYVQHIEFTGLTSAGKVAAKVEMLNHTSTTVDKDAPDIVFKNLNVWVGNRGYFSENKVKDPTITFMVDRSWVNDNGIILNTVSFYSYNDATNTWEKMSTQKIGEDSTSYQFRASLPIRGTLGPMAISGKELVYIPTPVPTPTPTPTLNVTEQPTPEITPTATPVTWTGIWMAKVPGFQLLAALIALVTLYFISRRRD